MADNTSLLVPSSYMDNISTLLCDTSGQYHHLRGANSEASSLSASKRRPGHGKQLTMTSPEVRAFQAEAKCRMEELQEQVCKRGNKFGGAKH